MRYVEYPPPPDLATWVECIWIFESSNGHVESETIVADGYPELIIHYGQRFSESGASGKLLTQPRAIISGQLTQPLDLHTPPRAGIVSIRFRPAGVARFTDVPMRELTDVRVEASETFENVDELIEGICSVDSDQQRVDLATSFLRRSLGKRSDQRRIGQAVDLVKAVRGNVSVEAIAKRVDMGRRNLELLFLHHVGVTPKQFCRIIRFRHAYDLLTSEDRSMASVAIDSGFFDQSHLIRDFRKFAGESPSKFFDGNMGLSHALSVTDADSSSSPSP